MPPIPCAHCGVNFMRANLDPEALKLCNNCIVREEKRTNFKKEDKMSTIDIVIKCPREDQIKIEEFCINHGMDFTRYFLELHYASEAAIEYAKENRLKLKPKPSVHEGEMVSDIRVKTDEKAEIQKKKVKKQIKIKLISYCG